MPSFDIVSEVDLQEIDNAVNQAKKEIETRYDFKGSKCAISYERSGSIKITADDTMKLRSVNDILIQKLSKRGVSTKSLEYKEHERGSGDTIRQELVIKEGIKQDDAKRVVKVIKESNIKKVQGQIQGEQVRVTGPKRDDLQQIIQYIKENVTDLDLQFTNFRD
jgi:uncharacterized protein YajQ (UPF0234 family)